jgi:hypothetical protein
LSIDALVIFAPPVVEGNELGFFADSSWSRLDMKASGDWWKARLWLSVVNMMDYVRLPLEAFL